MSCDRAGRWRRTRRGRGREQSRGRSLERNRHEDETAGRFRRRVSHRGSKHDRSRSDVGLGDQVAGTGERVLGSEPWLLSPESTRSQPPRDVLGAVWSQGRGSLSCGKRPKMRGFGESDVRRKPEETRHGGGRKCGELADWDSRHRRRRPGKPWKTGLSAGKNGYEEEKLRLRDYRRRVVLSAQ